ncbi:cell division initiation protein [Streptomyces sp. YC504]|uniref:Cell division initiation protein n=1 Tax=Streptomyces mesophilus TaxID=1775132 RepID=A0A6G4XTP1_9ACTN|nr:cell division initiation protein [Streptomyces mesophilus]NGO79971.1 cell division initiation protein [Streptomyces mesophilus]
MDVQKKLDEIVGAVEGARSMPMSASCVVNRADLLALLEEVRGALPGSLAQAEQVIGGSEQLVEQARQEAERIVQSAQAERGSLISDTAIARQSQEEAERIVAAARQEAEEIKAEADEYVDSKLANFEVVLTKTLGSVGRGREKLLGTGMGLDAQGYEDPDFTEAPERSHDPETQRQRADEYVDGKLGAFEAVLAKTLEAVGRGRQKLQGRIASDDLGRLDSLPQQQTTDADFLADIAEPQAPQQQSPQRQAPQQPPAFPQQDAYQQQPDPYAYQQQPDQQPDPYAYQQQGYDQSGFPTGGGQADPYGYQQPDPYAYQQQGYDQSGGYGENSGYPAADDQQAAALDETSLFDTSMISIDQLRQYEQGRGGQG